MPTSSPESPPCGATRRPVERVRSGAHERTLDALAEEVPVALRVNGSAHVVMMATPCDLEDLARGFALSEGLSARAGDIGAVTVAARLGGHEVDIALPRLAAGAAPGTRAIESRSGCGLCGVRELEDAVRQPPAVGAGPRISEAALRRALAGIGALQAINDATGAVHAAGYARADGSLALVREDVGRHNALDKLIGALAPAGLDAAQGVLVLTSRASYEMVVKAATAGFALVAAISAPTALAATLAASCGMTLVGFARAQSFVIYTRPERLLREEPAT